MKHVLKGEKNKVHRRGERSEAEDRRKRRKHEYTIRETKNEKK